MAVNATLNVEILIFFVQTINILFVNQSVIDMCASFFTLMAAVVEVDGTRMSRDSIYDQFVCRVWLTRLPLWISADTSTCFILLTALERYIAVICPIWYHNNVRTVDVALTFQCFYITEFMVIVYFSEVRKCAVYIMTTPLPPLPPSP